MKLVGLTASEAEVKKQREARQVELGECEKEIASYDWYYIRERRNGKPVPEDVIERSNWLADRISVLRVELGIVKTMP